MAKTKVEIASGAINAALYDQLPKAFKEKFGIEVKTEWNIFAGNFGAAATTRIDGKDLTKEQAVWVEAFETGIGTALNAVWKALN